MENSSQDSTAAPIPTREQAQGGFQARGAAHSRFWWSGIPVQVLGAQPLQLVSL